MKTIQAVYENGVFRPTEQVDLPERATVEFEPRVVPDERTKATAQKRIREILSRSHPTGIRDLAARHNEHQP